MASEFIIHKKGDEFQNSKKWKEFWSGAEDGRYLIKVQRHNKRSIPQNKWFHAVLPGIKDALRDAGFDDIKTEEDAKDLVKYLFFRKTVTNGMESFDIVEGTSAQSKINFIDKSEEIIRWAAEYLGLDIAPPEKQLQIKHENKN
jgi:hypothetical protein